MSAGRPGQFERAVARDHLFTWMVAVQEQSVRVVQAQYDHNREVDSILYALALRNLLRVAELARRFDRKAVEAALKAFRSAAPDVVLVRDVLEHFDEYETGRGTHQRKGRVPPGPPSIWWESDAGTVVINISGDHRLDVVAATAAASTLARALTDILA